MIRCFVGGVLLACGVAAFAQAPPATQPVPSGTPITLRLVDESPQSAFTKLAAQMHLSVRCNPENLWQRENGDLRINVSFDRVPFWEALTRLAVDSYVVPHGWEGGELEVGHDEGAWANRPAQIVGPLRVSVSYVDVRRTILIAHPPRRVKSSQITVTIEAEPGVDAVFISDATFPSVQDQKGRPIELEPVSSLQHQNFDHGQESFEVRLKAPADDVTAIGKLQANLTAAIARTQTLEISDIARASGLRKEIGGSNITIGCRKTPNGYTIDMQAEPKTPDPSWAAVGRAIQVSQASLVDAGGVPYRRAGGGSGNSPNRVNRSINFVSDGRGVGPNAGPPEKLVWIVPVSISSMPVTVEFKDLQLP